MAARHNTFAITADELLFLRYALLEGFRDPDLPETRGHEIGAGAPVVFLPETRSKVFKLLGLEEREAFVLSRGRDWNPTLDPHYIGELTHPPIVGAAHGHDH